MHTAPAETEKKWRGKFMGLAVFSAAVGLLVFSHEYVNNQNPPNPAKENQYGIATSWTPTARIGPGDVFSVYADEDYAILNETGEVAERKGGTCTVMIGGPSTAGYIKLKGTRRGILACVVSGPCKPVNPCK